MSCAIVFGARLGERVHQEIREKTGESCPCERPGARSPFMGDLALWSVQRETTGDALESG